MATPATLWRKLRSRDTWRHARQIPRYYAHGIYRQIADKDVFLWAQAIAFKVLITIVPIIILATGVLGQILRFQRPLETVANFLRDFLPAYRAEQILGFLKQLSGASSEFTLLGVAALLFSAVILFTTLRIAVGNVFQEDWHESRSIVGGYLFDFRMVLQVGLLFILTFALTLGLQYLNVAGFELLDRSGLDHVWLREGWRTTIKRLGLIVPFLLSTAMFFQLLYFIPKPHPPRSSALIGALTTALLWELAKYSFTWYATNVGRFDYANGGGEGVAAIGDIFKLIIAFVFWVYYSGIVLLLGAIITLLHEKQYRARRRLTEETGQAQDPEADRAETTTGDGTRSAPAPRSLPEPS